MKNATDTIEHVKTALANVQGNIHFIDTKVAGAMGLMAIVLGFCISRSVLAHQLRLSEPISLWYRIPTFILLVVAVGILVAAVWYAKKTLFPRTTTDPRLKDKKWVLFPMAGTDVDAIILHDILWNATKEGMSHEAILEEYIGQLAILGHIQTLKMKACRLLFKCAWWFCAIMLSLGAVSLMCHIEILSYL